MFPEASVAVISKLYVTGEPGFESVPVIAPVFAFSVTPPGNAPSVIEYVIA